MIDSIGLVYSKLFLYMMLFFFVFLCIWNGINIIIQLYKLSRKISFTCVLDLLALFSEYMVLLILSHLFLNMIAINDGDIELYRYYLDVGIIFPSMIMLLIFIFMERVAVYIGNKYRDRYK